jgi:membrane protein
MPRSVQAAHLLPYLYKIMYMRKRLRGFATIMKSSFTGWMEDDPFRQSAVIAYYAIFSLPALLVLIVNAAGLFFEKDVITGEISSQVNAIMGSDTADQIVEVVEKAGDTKAGVLPGILAVVTILFGSTGVFIELQKSLNQIWDVQQKQNKKFMTMLRSRLFSFGLILSIGFLLLVSLVISTILTAFGDWITSSFSDSLAVLTFVLEFLVSFGIISLLFALMFKFLPDVKIRFRDVWVGAFLTGLLFMLGKYGLSLYFGKASPGSVYGAAGSVVLILLWVSYSSMIVFFGAEFTKQHALFHKVKVEPSKNAEAISGDEKVKHTGKEEEKIHPQAIHHLANGNGQHSLKKKT